MARFRTLIHGLFTLMVLGFLFTAGCGKKSDATSVQLQLPQWPSKQSMRKVGDATTLAVADNIQVLIVNITGPGITTPTYFFWDRHSANSGSQPPTSLLFSVPRGSARLTQVMIVFEDESADTGMEFYYGDSTKDFNSDAVDVGIAVAAIGTSSRKDGNIAGRYLYADGSGPTGKVEFRYTPSGKPSMLLTHGYIYNGWFDFFGLEDVPFTYVLAGTGEVLFDKINLAGSAPSASAAIAKVNVPKYYYTKSYDANGNPTGARSANQGRTSIVGFFGPGAGSKPVCFSNTAVSLPGNYISSDTANSTLLQWVGNSATPNGNASVVYGGQVLASCPAVADVFTNHLRIDTARITNREGMLGFEGPYILSNPSGSSSQKQAITATTSGSGAGFAVALSWKYLPGVYGGSKGIAGSTLFVRQGQLTSNNRADYEGGDGIACADLVSKYGFAQVSDVSASSASGSVSLTSSHVSEANYSAGKFQAALCPYILNSNNDKVFIPESGVDFYTYPGGGGYSQPTATKLAAFKALSTTETSAANPASAYQGTCYPVAIAAVNSLGMTAGTSGSLEMKVTSADYDLYTSPTCDSGVTNLYTDYNFTGQRIIYWRPNGGGAYNLTITATGLTATTFYANFNAPFYADRLVTVAPLEMYRHDCRLIEFIAVKNGIPAAMNSATTFSLNSTDWNFTNVSYGGCGGSAATSFTFDGVKVSQQYWVKYIGTGTGAKIVSPTSATFTTNGNIIDSKDIQTFEPGAPAKLQIMGLPSNPAAEQCYTVRVAVTDANGHAIPVSNSIASGGNANINLTSTGALFWTSSCGMTSPAPTVTATDTIADTTLSSYGKTVSFSGTSGSITATLANPASGVTIESATYSPTVTSAHAVNFSILAPGQTFTPGTGVTGSPSARIADHPVQITLLATTFLKNIANGTNGTAAYNGVVTFAAFDSSVLEVPNTPVAFVDGTATMTIRFKPVTANSSRNIRLTAAGAVPVPIDSSYMQINYDLEPTKLSLYAMASYVQNACQPIYVAFEGATGVSRRLNQTTQLDFSTTLSSSAYSFGFASDCSDATGVFSPYISAGERGVLVYFKTTASSGPFNMSVSAPSTSYTAATSSGIPIGGAVGSLSQIRLWGNTLIMPQVCTPYLVGTTDSNGYSVAPVSNLSYTAAVNGSGAAIYTDPGCSYNDPYLIPMTGTSARAQIIYVKAAGSTTSLTVSASGLTGESKVLTPQ